MLELKNISKSYGTQLILDNISLQVKESEMVSILGPSGSGKSTLLQIIGLLMKADSGQIYLDGIDYASLHEKDQAIFRNLKLGFVFQFHYLLNEFSVLKNVMLPGLKLGKYSEKEIEHRAYEKLKILGIENEALKDPNQLSGGQKQRVAIARALINDPLLIMGDEPTGNLDKKNSEIVFNIFQELAEEYKQTLLIVTHDNEFAAKTTRIIEMEDGHIK